MECLPAAMECLPDIISFTMFQCSPLKWLKFLGRKFPSFQELHALTNPLQHSELLEKPKRPPRQ